MTDWRRSYLERAHLLVDLEDTDVTHEQVDAWDDSTLESWVESWEEGDPVEDIDHPGFDVDFLW